MDPKEEAGEVENVDAILYSDHETKDYHFPTRQLHGAYVLELRVRAACILTPTTDMEPMITLASGRIGSHDGGSKHAAKQGRRQMCLGKRSMGGLASSRWQKIAGDD